jgi:hypothetical protein
MSSLGCLVMSSTLTTTLLLSRSAMARSVRRRVRGRVREGGAWGAKAAGEGHVELALGGSEVEGGVPTQRPDRHEFCQ